MRLTSGPRLRLPETPALASDLSDRGLVQCVLTMGLWLIGPAAVTQASERRWRRIMGPMSSRHSLATGPGYGGQILPFVPGTSR